MSSIFSALCINVDNENEPMGANRSSIIHPSIHYLTARAYLEDRSLGHYRYSKYVKKFCIYSAIKGLFKTFFAFILIVLSQSCVHGKLYILNTLLLVKWPNDCMSASFSTLHIDVNSACILLKQQRSKVTSQPELVLLTPGSS